MSFLTCTTFRHLPTYRAAGTLRLKSNAGLRRPFGTTSTWAALSETDRDREDLHGEIDHHKHDALQKQKEGKGHWKGELASQSEAALKADRGEVDASQDQIDKLQKETEEFAEQQHKEMGNK